MSNGIDTSSIREHLGVCARICTFTFPAMIPLWMFPVAISCGNTFILKPSEKAPDGVIVEERGPTFRIEEMQRACIILAELVTEAGLPNGVLNIIHGTNAQMYMHGRPCANNSKYAKVAQHNLIVWAPTGEKAIERMKRALNDTIITGVPTTIEYHKLILDIEDFKNGKVDTAFIPKHEEELAPPQQMAPSATKELINSST
ncbi:uncharacterized protein LOC132598862 isoform X2 [Lycium barbarum]|uniref:uncharacterized protein LOC132598862 isoform X2 n=1 Tax=Lycium barbarum TaxID=112863 RepID=UPI00293F2420|nr:uncharacterized protein LOC132598862 isoform X2 [Lycium barbarum]